jgi:hypothetical protein
MLKKWRARKVDRIARIIEQAIDNEPAHRRLFPDLYARDVALKIVGGKHG